MGTTRESGVATARNGSGLSGGWSASSAAAPHGARACGLAVLRWTLHPREAIVTRRAETRSAGLGEGLQARVEPGPGLRRDAPSLSRLIS